MGEGYDIVPPKIILNQKINTRQVRLRLAQYLQDSNITQSNLAMKVSFSFKQCGEHGKYHEIAFYSMLKVLQVFEKPSASIVSLASHAISVCTAKFLFFYFIPCLSLIKLEK